MYQTSRSQRFFLGYRPVGKLNKTTRSQRIGNKTIVHHDQEHEIDETRRRGYAKIMNLHFNFLNLAGFKF